MKKITLFLFLSLAMALIYSCGGGTDDGAKESTNENEEKNSSDPETYDPKRGEGKYTSENLTLSHTPDGEMATYGEKVSGTKCASCHKLTDEKLVGPGWKGVTVRRTPQWLMNFITNPDPMIDKDPELQAMLEICLVRMPNQNLAEAEAFGLLEYMRKNDGVK